MTNYRFGLQILFVSVIMFVSSLCNAQENDVAFSVKFHPKSKYVPPLDSISKAGNSSMVEYAVYSHLNLYQRIDTTTGKVQLFNAAVFGRQTSFSNSGYTERILPDNLYSLSVGFSYYSANNNRWAYSVFLNSALNTNFISVDYNDLFLTGGGLFIRQFSPNFRLGFGAIIHNNLGKPMFWPALTVYWNFGNRFNFDIRVPDEGNGLAYTIGVGYKYTDDIKIAFAFKPQTISYDVEVKKGINNRLMNYWHLPFELSGTYSKGRMDFSVNIGFSALRSFTYAEKDIKNMFTKYPYYSLGSALSAGIGLRYRF